MIRACLVVVGCLWSTATVQAQLPPPSLPPIPVLVPMTPPAPPTLEWQSWVAATLQRLELKVDHGFAQSVTEHIEIKATVNRPDWLTKFFGSRIVQVGLALISGWILENVMDDPEPATPAPGSN